MARARAASSFDRWLKAEAMPHGNREAPEEKAWGELALEETTAEDTASEMLLSSSLVPLCLFLCLETRLFSLFCSLFRSFWFVMPDQSSLVNSCGLDCNST